MYFHCLSLSLSTVICCSQSDHLYLSHMILQQTHQMLCVAASLRSLLCCVAPITTDFPKLALCSQMCRSRYNFDGFFFVLLCRCQDFFKNSFFFFFYSANARAALLCCHSVNAVFWCWNAVTLCWMWLALPVCDPTKRPELELRFSCHRLVPLQSLCVSDSSNSGFIFYWSRRRSRWLCISLCVAASFCRPKPSGNTEETQRLVLPTAMCNWECTENVPTD